MERQESRMDRKVRSPKNGMDRLGDMYARQTEFAKTLGLNVNMPPAEVNRWLKELCLCSIMESAELLEETNWKHWKKREKQLDLEAARMEVVDELKFVLSKAIALSMTAEDLFQYFSRKGEINEQRQKDGY